MKHLNKILAGCLIAFGMTACSNDDGNTPDAPQKGIPVCMHPSPSALKATADVPIPTLAMNSDRILKTR